MSRCFGNAGACIYDHLRPFSALGYFTYRQKAKVYWEREARLKQLLDQGNDEWEVPRANVVINRQIGEGAFGIVNGGDAQFEVDGKESVEFPWFGSCRFGFAISRKNGNPL